MICPHCEGDHKQEQCPRIKSVEYDNVGNIKKVELDNERQYGVASSAKCNKNRLNLNL